MYASRWRPLTPFSPEPKPTDALVGTRPVVVSISLKHHTIDSLADFFDPSLCVEYKEKSVEEDIRLIRELDKKG